VATRSPDDNLIVILFTDGKITKGHKSLNPLNSAVQQSGIAVNPILFYGNNTAPEIFNVMEQLVSGLAGRLENHLLEILLCDRREVQVANFIWLN
jgi:hypothetical protein